MKIAVIPARGGSKRIPHKNIKDFLGKPIIAYSIETAKKSGLFDHIIVSTDDAMIAEIAIKYGAIVPFLRPTILADDFIGTMPVIKHAVMECEKIYGRIDKVCCIYPTAPLLQSEFLHQALNKLEQNDSLEFVFSAAEFAAPIFRAFQLHEDKVNMFWPENFNKRSQDLPKAFYDAGQFYFGRGKSFLVHDVMFAHHSSVILLPPYMVQDIDTMDDWDHAELLYKMLHK